MQYTFGQKLTPLHECTATDRAEFEACHGVRNDGQIHTSALNVDDMAIEDMMCAKEHPALHEDIRLYVDLRLQAHDCRVGGYVHRATSIEQKLDTMYDTLPHNLKW